MFFSLTDFSIAAAMVKLMGYIFNVMSKTPLSSWAQYRWQDYVLAIHWMVSRDVTYGQKKTRTKCVRQAHANVYR